MWIYERLLKDEYEGMVVRNFFGMYERKRSPLVMKFKPKKDDFYEVVGFKQMLDKDKQYKPLLGSLQLQGDDGTKFWVGSGMTDSFRDKYWPEEEAKKLLGKFCHVKYQHLTDKKVPRFPVFVEVEDG
jgi:ATP-dependent DNA ligase